MTGSLLYASVLLSTLTDASFALLIGLLLAELWLAAAASSQPVLNPSTTHRTLLRLIALLTLAHLTRPWFLAASMSGSTSFRENLATIPDILFSTQQGKLWFYNSAAIILLFLATIFKTRRPNNDPARYVILLALLAIAFLKAATSHAADDGFFTLLVLSQTIHIAATAVWAGTILISGLIIIPRLVKLAGEPTHEPIWHYGNSLSSTATYAVIAVLLTGVFTGYRELNAPLTTLFMTLWGKVLFTKIVIVLLALALGGASRFLCLRGPANAPKLRLFTRLLFAEAISMAVILCLSGLLGNTSPAMSMPM